MVRVRNKEGEGTFLAGRSHLLNECKPCWEDNNKMKSELPKPLDPNHPYTRIHPYYLELGLKFLLSPLSK